MIIDQVLLIIQHLPLILILRFYEPDCYMCEEIEPEFEYAASKYDERWVQKSYAHPNHTIYF